MTVLGIGQVRTHPRRVPQLGWSQTALVQPLLDQTTEREFLSLSAAQAESLVASARDMAPVSGLSHSHYKYPARFSPKFVRAAIEAFTDPGELVLDPFLGGGTTMVEALALSRNCVGIDISSLATFVSEAKTLVLSDEEFGELNDWADAAPGRINMQLHTVWFAVNHHEGYYRNIESKKFWRIRKAIEQALASVFPLSQYVEKLARCIVLRTAQWALDGRRNLPTVEQFRKALAVNAETIIKGALEFRAAFIAAGGTASAVCLNRTGVGLEDDPLVVGAGVPRLILTSPPYPGVHVLYHRWQVDGRKETPAPFLIANQLDGSGESYYTLGQRKHPELKSYFENLKQVLRSAVAVSNQQTIVVQVVAFSEPEWQLPRYLEVCVAAGLKELAMPNSDAPDGRLWRTVPNRRWYAGQMGDIPASQEVVLFHRLGPKQQSPPDRFAQTSARPSSPGSGATMGT